VTQTKREIRMIVIISHLEDEHATHVYQRLKARNINAVLFDSAAFPQQISLSIAHQNNVESDLLVEADNHINDLREARVVWWRRPMPINLHDELIDAESREFAHGECHSALNGLWSCLDAHWINDPQKDEAASRKAWQLKVASQLGLRIPRTLITNDPERAKAFVANEGDKGTIYKAFLATESAWRETRLIKENEVELLDAVRFAPVIFQEHIKADIDLRITMIGDRLFASEIDSGLSDYKVDGRMNLGRAQIKAHELPINLQNQLHDYMSKLGLIYGAIDLRLTPEGEYVFLEVNTAGQWLFMEQRTGQQITDAFIDYLADHAS